MPYHTIDLMNWSPKDDAVIPRWVTIKNCAPGEKLIQTANIWLSCTEYVISAGLL